VTADGNPKLLDFGIAKSFADPVKSTTIELTPFTPAFASPEQVLGSGSSPRSDVYSLGLILYPLLTGRGPFAEPGEVKRDDFVEALVGKDAPAPSAVTGSEDVPGFPESGAELRAKLAGGLDSIVGRAICLRPPDRYQTAGALADDLARYLQRVAGR
jgi:eukaryotic-like serine/threonine-protein kinase